MTDLPNKAFLRPITVAKWLDMPIKTLYELIAEGKVPAYRISPRSIRIKKEDAEKIPQSVAS